MRLVPDGEHPEWMRLLREQARRDAEALVPRPGFPVYGLAAPVLTPAAVMETGLVNGEWTSITLACGPWDLPAGPYIAITTAVAHPAATAMADSVMVDEMRGSGPEAELRNAVARER
jgi:hypothetical protein